MCFNKNCPQQYVTMMESTWNLLRDVPFSLQFAPDTSYSFNSYKYLLIDAPKNMHIDNSGLFSWEPNPSQVDLNSFIVVISDDMAESRQSVSVYVNSNPLISSSPPNILYLIDF